MRAIDETLRAAITERACQLADQAPPLTSDQIARLRAIFGMAAGDPSGGVD